MSMAMYMYNVSMVGMTHKCFISLTGRQFASYLLVTCAHMSKQKYPNNCLFWAIKQINSLFRHHHGLFKYGVLSYLVLACYLVSSIVRIEGELKAIDKEAKRIV